jgi:hypothetical protein
MNYEDKFEIKNSIIIILLWSNATRIGSRFG